MPSLSYLIHILQVFLSFSFWVQYKDYVSVRFLLILSFIHSFINKGQLLCLPLVLWGLWPRLQNSIKLPTYLLKKEIYTRKILQQKLKL